MRHKHKKRQWNYWNVQSITCNICGASEKKMFLTMCIVGCIYVPFKSIDGNNNSIWLQVEAPWEK